MKGIIIDGVVSSGKTSILKHLHRKISEQYPSSTKLFISEHYTDRMLEHLREKDELTGVHIKDHMESIITTLKSFQDMLDQSKFASNPRAANTFVTLERFILTHMASTDTEDRYSIQDARRQFKILAKLGIKQVLLIIPEVNFKEKIMSTLAYRNEGWKKHLYSKGGEKEIVDYYMNWQKNLLDYAEKFKNVIDTLIIEVNDDDYIKYSDIILNHCFNENKD